MSVDKKYCMSSYLAFRYIEDSNKEFSEGLSHHNFVPFPDEEKVMCYSSKEIGDNIERQIVQLKRKYKKLGVMLSGGMDSAIVASYMRGCDAYTFRFLNGKYQTEELKRA